MIEGVFPRCDEGFAPKVWAGIVLQFGISQYIYCTLCALRKTHYWKHQALTHIQLRSITPYCFYIIMALPLRKVPHQK